MELEFLEVAQYNRTLGFQKVPGRAASLTEEVLSGMRGDWHREGSAPGDVCRVARTRCLFAPEAVQLLSRILSEPEDRSLVIRWPVRVNFRASCAAHGV